VASKPTLVFLHGVGTGDPEGKWKERLAESLVRVGYPDLSGVHIIAPRYAHALKGADESERIPPLVGKQPSGEAARKNRREFERRMGAIEFRLGRQNRGAGYIGGDKVVDFAAGTRFFAQARNYLTEETIRAQVLNRVLSKLPDSGPIVLVAHSLGSVIAADLLRRLPDTIEIVGMVTIGSPLANESFGVGNLRDVLREPPPHLAWWVSFWDGRDPVAARRGVSSAFPWMIDFRVNTRELNPAASHQAVEYLSHDVVAEAIGFALFGSRSTELAHAEKGVDVPLDTAESFAILALRYAHLIRQRLDGDKQDRYAGALRNVQANIVAILEEQRAHSGRPLPAAIAEIAVDLTDPDAMTPEPRPARHLAKDQAVVPLTVLMAENVILPYEISIPGDISESAMVDLAAEMGLGGVFGSDAFAAAKSAQRVLGGGQGVNWFRWGALGAGAAALVVATGGLALAAGAGLAGAAAITSALAAFGPGGMIGGLLTAGTLVTAGGGGIALGLASSGTSAETLEAVASVQLTAEILRKQHGLESDPAVRRNLVEMEMELRREHERLDEFSDASAPSVKELKRKIEVVERALEHLDTLSSNPDGDAGESDSATARTRAPWYERTGRAASAS